MYDGWVGAYYEQTLRAAGGSGSGYTWTIAGGTLDTLVLDPATGVIAGAPSRPGVISFIVRVTDSTGLTAIRLLSIRVAGDRIGP